MTAALENSILAKVIAAIQQTVFLRDVQITPETRFAEDLGLDSLDVTEIALHLEEVFDVEFPQEVIAHLGRVADMLRYLSRRFFADTPELAHAD